MKNCSNLLKSNFRTSKIAKNYIFGPFEFPTTWFHVKNEWQWNHHLISSSFTIWKFLEHSAVCSTYSQMGRVGNTEFRPKWSGTISWFMNYYKRTVWKFHDFSITQNFTWNQFWGLYKLENCHFCIFWGSEVHFLLNFSTQKM